MVNKIVVGTNPKAAGLTVCREINESKPFVPLVLQKTIEVSYKEWNQCNDGSIFNGVIVDKVYYVKDVPEKLNEDGSINKPAYPAFTGWFNSLARQIDANQYGIYDQIEATLAALPLDVENGYILQSP